MYQKESVRKSLKIKNTQTDSRSLRDALLRGERDIYVLINSATDYTHNLTPAGKEGINGGSLDGTSHQKYIDKENNIWLFKEYPIHRIHRALVDEFVYQVAVSIGIQDAVRIFAGKVNGKFGVFVQWVDNEGSFWDEVGKRGKDFVEDLTPAVIKRIVREQVLDWLVSQHDSHSGSFLKSINGKHIYPIDKAQAYKYIGRTDSKAERLAPDYNPNGDINGYHNVMYMPIYNLIFEAMKLGKCTITLEEAWKEIQPALDAVDELDNEDFIAALRAYAIFRFDVIKNSEEYLKSSHDFLILARERKDNLRNDFHKFYESQGLNIRLDEAILIRNNIPKDVQLLLLDLDDSIAARGEEISQETADLLSEADSMGIQIAILSEDSPSEIHRRVTQQLRSALQHEMYLIGYGGAKPIDSEMKEQLYRTLQVSLGENIEYISDANYQLRIKLKSNVERSRAAEIAQQYLEKKAIKGYVFFAESDPNVLKVFVEHKKEAAERILENLRISEENVVIIVNAVRMYMSDRVLALRFPKAKTFNVGEGSTTISQLNANVIQLDNKNVANTNRVLAEITHAKKAHALEMEA